MSIMLSDQRVILYHGWPDDKNFIPNASRNDTLSMYFPTYAIPAAHDRPCPREPVATSIKSSRGVGWPSRSQVIFRIFIISVVDTCPA